MKIDDKIIDTRKFLMENETQLQNEISELVDDMNNANDLSRKKFDRQREEANYEFEDEDARLDALIEEAGEQISAIKNKSFRKYYKEFINEEVTYLMAGKVYENASMVYDKLLYEIELFKHDRNKTPFQRFIGKLISIFKPSYRREEVKKIMMIYCTLKSFQKKNDAKELLLRKIAKINDEEKNCIIARRNAVNEQIDEKIKSYKKLLEHKLLNR